MSRKQGRIDFKRLGVTLNTGSSRNLTVWVCTFLLMLPTLLMPSGMCVCRLLDQFGGQSTRQLTNTGESYDCCSRCSGSSRERSDRTSWPNRPEDSPEKSGSVPQLPLCCEAAASHHLANLSDSEPTAFEISYSFECPLFTAIAAPTHASRLRQPSPPLAVLPHHVFRIMLI